MKKLNYWFTLWQLRNYPVSALIPNWFLNLSWFWSKKERELQAGVARTHKQIGEQLMTEAEFNAMPSPDVVELSIEGDMDSNTLFIDLKPRPMSWQEKLDKDEGIIL